MKDGIKYGSNKALNNVTPQRRRELLAELTQLSLPQAALITGGNLTPAPEEPKPTAPVASSTSSEGPPIPGGNGGRPPFN